MKKDPTEFRKRFKAWKNGLLVYLGGRPTEIQIADKSNANFIERLKAPIRENISAWEDPMHSIATHKLSYSSYDEGDLIYPKVYKDKDGKLKDWSNPTKSGWNRDLEFFNAEKSAIERGDTLWLPKGKGEWFTTNYKKYYPGFEGGKDEDDILGIKKAIKNRLRRNINPASSYAEPIKRVINAVVLNKPDYSLDRDEYADAAWDKYLGFKNDKIRESKYKPSMSSENSKYYTYDDLILTHKIDDVLGPEFTEDVNRNFINDALRLKIGGTAIGNNPPILNDFTYSHGYDEKGDYISVYDKYDINPFKNKGIFKNKGDVSFGIGKPFELYDRLYLDDYYNLPSNGAHYLPEVLITPKKNYKDGKDENDITTLRELTVTPNGSYAMTSSDDMYRNLQYNITRAQYENNLNAYNLLRNMNAAQEIGAATIGGALASIVGDPLGYGLIKGGASLLNAAKNLPLFARRVWNGGNIIQRNIPISPKNYYRTIIGNDALNDAFNTGIIRGSKSFNGAPYFSHNGLIVLPAGKHAYVIEGTPSTPVQWTGAYQFRVPSKLRPNGSYIPIERIPDASPKSMLPVSEDILTEAIPWSNGSYQVPTTGFTYWLKHPIIGWRNHSFASRGNTSYASQWDLANAYADAKAYADSPLRVQLFELLKKEAADAGYISLNSLLLLGRMHSRKPLIKFEDLGPDVLGKYLSDKHQILLNITDPNPLTPYHEYLHSLDVGRPFKDSFTLTKKYKQLKRRATKFGDQEAAKEVMRYSDDAYGMDDFYTHKANQIIESSADPYYKDPLEIDAYGLEEGKRLFMPTFSPKPSDEVLQRMFQQSLNGPYGHFFKHLKVGDNTLDTYWKLLSGLFLPIGLGGAYIMNQNYKNGKDSGIHIKPSHRGRLTALKKRTGKSEAELYKTGGPAVRKMITFARNARKWKH